MRETEVTVLDKDSSAGSTTTIEFETAAEFVAKVNSLLQSLPFQRYYIEFDEDEFDDSEVQTLQEGGLL